MINTVAGIIVLISVLLVGYNLLLVLSNANLGENGRYTILRSQCVVRVCR
jgi:hypothetical protein